MRRVVIGLGSVFASVLILLGAVAFAAIATLLTAGYSNVRLPGGYVLSTTEPSRVAAATVIGPTLSESWVRGLVNERLLCRTTKLGTMQLGRYNVTNATYSPESGMWRVKAEGVQVAAGGLAPPPGIREAPPLWSQLSGSWLVEDRTGKVLPEDGLEAALKDYCER